MTLFSTLNEPFVLWLFLYLGALCGVVYFSFCKIFSIFDRRKLLQKDVLENSSQQKRIKPNQKGKKKTAFSFKKFLSNIFKKVFQFISQIGKFIVFVLLCFLTFYVNLQLNYGELNFFCLFAYVFSFFMSKYLLKIVANFFLWLYNVLRKKGFFYKQKNKNNNFL